MIESPTNPTVKHLKSLATAKARKEHGQFLVEGVRLVEDGLQAGFWPEVCIYNRELLERTERGKHLLRSLHRTPHGKATPLEASERTLEAASDTQHPQGIVTAFSTSAHPAPAKAVDRPLVLVCDDIQDPGNLGTILRTAEAAGVHSVLLTPRCVDLFSPKVVRAAMGAHFRLPALPEQDWQAIESAIQAIHVPDGQCFASEMDAGQAYDQVDWTQPSALIVSNEAHGLTPEARRVAGPNLISIPMAGGTESLNAAIAAAVILFEAARQRRTARA